MVTCGKCYRATDGGPHLCVPQARNWLDEPERDLVPGYADSPDGRADLDDQRRWSRLEGQS
jgi:hypothetical protein